MLWNQLSALLTSVMPLSFGTCVPSTEDTRCSTVHIWCVLALFLIGLQYNHLIKLTAKIKTRGSSLGKLNGSKLGSNTLLRQLPSFWLFRAGLKLGAFPSCSLVWHTSMFTSHMCQRTYITSAWPSGVLPVICHSVSLPYILICVDLYYLEYWHKFCHGLFPHWCLGL